MTKMRTKVEFTDKIEVAEDEIKQAERNAVEKAARILERKTKSAATRSFNQQTGNLRRSIRAYKTSPLNWEVQANPTREGGGEVNYAKFLEFGTRWIAPRAFMRKGADDARSAIIDQFGDELRSINIGFSGSSGSGGITFAHDSVSSIL